MKLDWESSKNEFLLNPRLPAADAERMNQLARLADAHFTGHFFLMTSGTSRKDAQGLHWIALSKAAFLACAGAVNQHLQVNASDLWVLTLPEFHVGGLAIQARSYLSGAKVVSVPIWNAYAYVKAIEESSATLGALVPTQIFDLVSQGLRAPASLRAVIAGGGVLSYSLYQKARELGWTVLPAYGMTETCSQIATASLDFKGYDSLPEGQYPGLKLLSHLEARLNSEKLFQLKGPALLTATIEFAGDFSEDKLLITDPKDSDGWYTTQDRGQIIGDTLYVFGRSSDFVKIGGESVELSRLKPILDELRLVQLKSDIDLDLLPIPDERLGHVIGLISDTTLSPSQAQLLIDSFNKLVLPFERIRQWHTFERIPRTALGKLITNECLEGLGIMKTAS